MLSDRDDYMKTQTPQGSLEIVLLNLAIFLKSNLKKWLLWEQVIWISEWAIKGKLLNGGLITLKSFEKTFQ